MNIILLSGGSGKRLWPLSNDVRSKQFVKIYKDENNNYESMIQRVYRQIKQVDRNANIIIATSKSQVSSIKNQLGENVSICVEPDRKDTFPAIALAASYLYDELSISEKEAVIVCPVDPYVDNNYYECLKILEKTINNSSSNITLMGIEPTSPSEKFGYIIPTSSDKITKVKEFKEKPNVDLAKKYIEQNALWNAGVFGFKLGYILKKAHELLDFKNFSDLYEKYDSLKKISFDYAVVENESSIDVVRYSGDWKDVGTWNMITEVMDGNIIGNALMDETSTNTTIINELDIPILAMGCNDMIIAANHDGIFVSDKEQSVRMKSFVENISTDFRYAEKSWGTYEVIDVQHNAKTIKLSINQGKHMSYHSHNNRFETWTIIDGVGTAIIDGVEKQLNKGQVITIHPGCKHTIFANSKLDIIEVQIGDSITSEDKIKHMIK